MKAQHTSKIGRAVVVGSSAWFGSFFGVATTVILANAIAAQWSGVSKIWAIVAWAVFISHVLAYAGMCLFVLAITGASLSAITGSAAMRDKPNK